MKRLSDRKWRLNNLYYITDKQGKKVKFQMNTFQELLLDNMWYLSVVLKARQLGISTFIVMFILDACLFNSNQTGGIIDYTLPDAKKKLEKARFAYMNLPEMFQKEIRLLKDNEQELSFSNGSSITADTTFRGSTLQYLHISEHAKICKKEPIKAKEIKNGALNAVAAGQIVFIESTAEDGEGDFYDICHTAEAMKESGEHLSKLDFKFFFFPWWEQKEYALDMPPNYRFTTDIVRYFKDLEQMGIHLTDNQKYWYVKKKVIHGEDIKKEYPSTSTEAFEASNDDKYYKQIINILKAKNHMTEFEVEKSQLVDVAMDLGSSDYTSIIFYQVVGKEIRILDFLEGSGEHISYYIGEMKAKGYRYGRVVIPHDGNNKLLSARKSVYQQLKEAGLDAFITPKLGIELGINEVRKLMPNMWFKHSTTEKLVDHLEKYSKKWNEVLGRYTDPKHDKHSHAADAMRYLAVSYREKDDEDEFETLLKADDPFYKFKKKQEVEVYRPNGGY